MSSLFSDPPFPRGTTLLNNENIDLDPNGLPIAGGEIVGSIKVFPDMVPGTGPAAIRNSNRLVYCLAARYTPVDGITKLNVGGTGADKGKWYVLDRRGPLGTFSTAAAATDITDGRIVGVLDEYLNTEVRPNDIVWLVVKGPSTTQKGNTVVIPGGLGIEVASGLSVTKATTVNMVAQSIDPVLLKTGTASSASTSLTVTDATDSIEGFLGIRSFLVLPSDDLHGQILAMEAAARALRQELDFITGTRSWKVTAPLRRWKGRSAN